jgi:hypothetical protein
MSKVLKTVAKEDLEAFIKAKNIPHPQGWQGGPSAKDAGHGHWGQGAEVVPLLPDHVKQRVVWYGQVSNIVDVE